MAVVLSYFEGTANLHCYTSCTLTTLHCSKVSFLQCCHMKRYNKILQKCEGCTHFCEILYVCVCVCVCSGSMDHMIFDHTSDVFSDKQEKKVLYKCLIHSKKIKHRE